MEWLLLGSSLHFYTHMLQPHSTVFDKLVKSCALPATVLVRQGLSRVTHNFPLLFFFGFSFIMYVRWKKEEGLSNSRLLTCTPTRTPTLTRTVVVVRIDGITLE